MPMYEYKCSSCGEVFEVIQRFSDEPLTVHDKCGGKVERLISAPALQFKGTGWYITDYARGNSGGSKNGKSESSSTTSSSSSDTTTSSSSSSTDKK